MVCDANPTLQIARVSTVECDAKGTRSVHVVPLFAMIYLFFDEKKDFFAKRSPIFFGRIIIVEQINISFS